MTKKLGITINDDIMCATSTAFLTLFQEKKENVSEINIAIPANIRFKPYKNREDVKLENKFAAIPLKLPIVESMEKGYPKIKKISNQLKKSIGLIYSSYAFVFYGSQILPRFVNKQAAESTSKKFTISFSNTPGLQKPV